MSNPKLFKKSLWKLVKTNIEQYLFINLRKINDENLDLYKQLIKFNFIELTNEDIEDIFNSKEVLEPIYSLQKIDFSIQKQLLEYDAFEIFEVPMREYLYSNVFSHSIGYVGIPNSEEEKEYVNAKGNKLVGKNGLEKFYENSLAGVPGKVIFKGDQIIEYIDPIPGQDLTVTLNIELQEVVIESLIEGLNLANKNFESESNIERGAVVVLNIETGAVEAMVSLPDFDPNLFVDGISQFDFTRLDRKQAFNNFAIQGLYPPGSVFKVVAYWLAVSENIFPVELNSKDENEKKLALIAKNALERFKANCCCSSLCAWYCFFKRTNSDVCWGQEGRQSGRQIYDSALYRCL